MSAPLAVLGPEARILLETVPDGLGIERPVGPSSASPSGREAVDWEALYRLLERERAAAALHPVVERLGLDPPADWRDRFQALGAVSGFRLKRLLAALEDAAGLLAGRGISVCLLKGAALALTAYPDPLQRPMADLDLLVEPGAEHEAWGALTDAGWTWDRDRYPARLYEPRQHLPPLQSPDGRGRFVELHHDLFIDGHPFRLGPDDLRSGADPIEVGGVDLLVPAPDRHLVYTCVHFAWGHAVSKGGWRTFRDVAVLSRVPGFRWPEFRRLAGEYRADRSCYWTLRLARSLGGVGVPEEVLSALEPGGMPSPVIRALERHFALTLFAVDRCPSVSLGRMLWRLAVRPSGPGPRGALPWEYDEGFVERESGPGAEVRPGAVRRVGGQMADPSAWRRYLGSVLGLRAERAARSSP